MRLLVIICEMLYWRILCSLCVVSIQGFPPYFLKIIATDKFSITLPRPWMLCTISNLICCWAALFNLFSSQMELFVTSPQLSACSFWDLYLETDKKKSFMFPSTACHSLMYLLMPVVLLPQHAFLITSASLHSPSYSPCYPWVWNWRFCSISNPLLKCHSLHITRSSLHIDSQGAQIMPTLVRCMSMTSQWIRN